MIQRCCLSIVLFFLVQTGIKAQYVDSKTGNLSVSYSDVEFPDHPLGFEITRTYNSRTVTQGWFGMGWGSFFEAFVFAIPGGGVALHHYGSGSREIFRPAQWNTQEIAAGVNKLLLVAQHNLDVTTPEEITALKNKLLTDETARIDKWSSYLRQHLVEPIHIAAGTRLSSSWGGASYMVVTDRGFQRPLEDGKIDYFDSLGRYTRLADAKGNEIVLEYADKNTPAVIRDNKGNAMRFQFDDNDLLQKIYVTYAGGKKDTTTYTYNKNTSTLATSTDAEKNFYRFEWDNNFNLIKIHYSDGKEAIIEYNALNRAVSVKRKNGERFLYDYPQVSDNEYGTSTIHYDSAGKLEYKLSQWYVVKTNEIGDEWLYKRIVVFNDDSVTYINSERFENPDTVYLNKGIYYTYRYDKIGHVKQIFSNGKLHATVTVEDDKLLKIVTPKYSITPVYKDDQIEKLLLQDQSVVLLPVKEKGEETTELRKEIQAILHPFKYTFFWYPLYLRD